MGEVDRKSIATLIDELVTTRLKLFVLGKSQDEFTGEEVDIVVLINALTQTNIEIFFALEDANILAKQKDYIGVGQAYGKAQALNSRRTALIAKIDERLGEGDISQNVKTF